MANEYPTLLQPFATNLLPFLKHSDSFHQLPLTAHLQVQAVSYVADFLLTLVLGEAGGSRANAHEAAHVATIG